jgi:ribose transport system permease protein
MTEQLLRPHPGSRFLDRSKLGSMQALLRRLPIETYVNTFTLVLWIALSLATPNFLTENNVANMMRQTSIAAIVAIGVMFTIVIAGIDLSVGSVAAFCGVAFAQMCRHGLGIGPAALLTLSAGVVVGSTNALAIARLGIPAFIVTLAGLQSYRGLALLLAGGMTVGGFRPRSRISLAARWVFRICSGRCWLSLSPPITSCGSLARDAIYTRWAPTPRQRVARE